MGALDVALRGQAEIVIFAQVVDRLAEPYEAEQALADELLDRDLLGSLERRVVGDVHVLRDDVDLAVGLEVLPADLVGPVVEELAARLDRLGEQLQVLPLGELGHHRGGFLLFQIELIEDARQHRIGRAIG